MAVCRGDNTLLVSSARRAHRRSKAADAALVIRDLKDAKEVEGCYSIDQEGEWKGLAQEADVLPSTAEAGAALTLELRRAKVAPRTTRILKALLESMVDYRFKVV